MKIKSNKTLKDVGVGRIDQASVEPTIQFFSTVCEIPREDLHSLGSTGKYPSSGDIDLAVDVNLHSKQLIHSTIVSKLRSEQIVVNQGTRVISYAIPICGDRHQGAVQVDVMYVDSVSWAKFAYFADPTSEYSGAVRTILLSAIASAINVPGVDYFHYEVDGSLSVRAGRTFDLNNGLRRIFQYRPMRKDGTALTKTLKTITYPEFQELFPDLAINNSNIIDNDPTSVLNVLLGNGISTDDVRTAEQVIVLIKDQFNELDQQRIFDIASKRTSGLVTKMKLPKEFSNEIN